LSFTSPLGLLLLLAVPVLIILHLFRQERRRKEVSSIFLWREIQDQQSRRMRPHLLRNINLILQLLAVIAGAFALSRPILNTTATIGSEELVVVIDTSASMSAQEDGVSRIDLATNRAREIVGRARRDTRIMLLSAGPDPAIVQSYTTDRNALYDALRTIEPREGRGEIDAALALARSVAFGSSTQIILVTDGAFEFAPGTELPANLSASFVGTDLPNRAITAFELRSRPDGSAVEAYIAVANYSETATSVLLELTADQELVTREEIDLGPNEERELSLAIRRRGGTVYRGRLVDNTDALPADDHAFAVASGTRPVRTQLVTPGNLFLESFLSVYPNLDLTVTSTVDRSVPFDLLILDDVDAPSRLSGSVVALGTYLPDGPFTPLDLETPTQSTVIEPDHPVMRDTGFGEASIQLVSTGELSPRASVVASSGEMPLVYVIRTSELQLVGFTFSLTASDLPLRGSFPVLMHNIIQWLAPIAPAGDVGYNRIGEPIPLFVPVGEQIAIARPDGSEVIVTPRTSPYRFDQANQAGIYTVVGESFADRFAVTLADMAESDLTPRLMISPERSGQIAGETQTAGRSLWPWFALVALLLLVAEWIVWARRT
jgi:hypothetical protein